jgi:hypothetical protein
MMVGMFRQMASGINENDLRAMSGRVGLGMLHIYAGASARDSLSMDVLISPEMDMLIEQLNNVRIDLQTEPAQLEAQDDDFEVDFDFSKAVDDAQMQLDDEHTSDLVGTADQENEDDTAITTG